MGFLDYLKNETNKTTTLNGACALKSTGNDLVDLFGAIGALRKYDSPEVFRRFSKAFAEDNLLAMKLLFYARDVRGGLGEIKTTHAILHDLAIAYPETVIKNFKNIAEFGRWDDFYVLVNTPCEQAMWEFISKQLQEDMINCKNRESISLLAKWLASPKTSSPKTSELGRYTAKKLNLTDKEYRLTLSTLRSYLNIVEVHMSANHWSNIAYSHVPSKAMHIYKGAFQKHDTERFSAYIGNVISGEEKINASTLYPYDIIEQVLYGGSRNKIHEEQWKALPDYINDTENDVIIMADVSGSMHGRPMATSIGLALYFAERNKGAYHNTFMTFSSDPSLVTIKGNTLYEKVNMISRADWSMSTNFEKAMMLILNTAINNNVPPEELPKSLVVISDMQFDSALGGMRYNDRNWSFYDTLREKFTNNGYTIPNIVFWNVNNLKNTFQTDSNLSGVQYVSGQSPAVFKTVLKSIGKTPYEAMVETLNNPRYDSVEV